MKQKSFIFMGKSGCGKSTQAKQLIQYLKEIDPTRNVLHVETGSEFRKFIKGDEGSMSETQKICKALYDTGGLQPEFLAIYMWISILLREFTNTEHLIFDGTSRKLQEAVALDSIFSFYGLEKPYVINISISHDESIKRLMARGRQDDTPEKIKERLSWYETEVEQSIEFYKESKNYTFLQIHGERSIEEIHKEIIGYL